MMLLVAFIALIVPLIETQGMNTAPAFATPHSTTRASTWIAPIVTSAGILLSSTFALADEANLLNGATLFQANCAGCHAGGMNFISEKKTLRKDALEKYRSLDQVQIQKYVQQGMPHKLLPFSKTMTGKDYLDATTFVLDQALNDKW
jgi:cytochrome c6